MRLRTIANLLGLPTTSWKRTAKEAAESVLPVQREQEQSTVPKRVPVCVSGGKVCARSLKWHVDRCTGTCAFSDWTKGTENRVK